MLLTFREGDFPGPPPTPSTQGKHLHVEKSMVRYTASALNLPCSNPASKLAICKLYFLCITNQNFLLNSFLTLCREDLLVSSRLNAW